MDGYQPYPTLHSTKGGAPGDNLGMYSEEG